MAVSQTVCCIISWLKYKHCNTNYIMTTMPLVLYNHVDMKSFGLSCEDAEDKDDQTLRKRGQPRLD